MTPMPPAAMPNEVTSWGGSFFLLYVSLARVLSLPPRGPASWCDFSFVPSLLSFSSVLSVSGACPFFFLYMNLSMLSMSPF